MNRNTGIQTNKSNFCIELANKRGLGLGAGDMLSDSGIALPTIMKDPNNPRDIPGRFLLMNPRADVLKAVRTSFNTLPKFHLDLMTKVDAAIQGYERERQLEKTLNRHVQNYQDQGIK